LDCFFKTKLKSFAGSGNKCKQTQEFARIRKKTQENGRKRKNFVDVNPQI